MEKALSDPEAWFKCRYCLKCYQGATNFIQHKQDTHEEYWIDRKKRETIEAESNRQPSASSSEYDKNSESESTSESESPGSSESSLPESDLKAEKIAAKLRHLTDENVELSDDCSESSFEPDSNTSEESDSTESSKDESYAPSRGINERSKGSGRLTRNRLKELSKSPEKQAESLQCQYCEKKFRCRGPLRIHLRVHTGERPYKCSICSRRFTDLDAQKKHELSSHFEIVVSQNLKTMAELSEESDTLSDDQGKRYKRKRNNDKSSSSRNSSSPTKASRHGGSNEHKSSSPAKNLRSSRSTENLRSSPRKQQRRSSSRDSFVSSPSKDARSYLSNESHVSLPSQTSSGSSKSKESLKSSPSADSRITRSKDSLNSTPNKYSRIKRSKANI